MAEEDKYPTFYQHVADIPPEVGNTPLRALAIVMIGESGELNVMRHGMTKEQFHEEVIPALTNSVSATESITRPQ